MSWINQLFLAGQGFGNKYVVPCLLTLDGFLEDIRKYGNCDITVHDRVLLLNALNANRVNHNVPILEGHHIDWETNLEKARIAAMKNKLEALQQQIDLMPPIAPVAPAQASTREVGRIFRADPTPDRRPQFGTAAG